MVPLIKKIVKNRSVLTIQSSRGLHKTRPHSNQTGKVIEERFLIAYDPVKFGWLAQIGFVTASMSGSKRPTMT